MERDPERKARECAEHLRRAEDIAYGSTANTAKALRTAAQGDPAGAAWLADRAEWMRTTGSTDNEQLIGSALERVAGEPKPQP